MIMATMPLPPKKYAKKTIYAAIEWKTNQERKNHRTVGTATKSNRGKIVTPNTHIHGHSLS